jgi:hypothetical protein
MFQRDMVIVSSGLKTEAVSPPDTTVLANQSAWCQNQADHCQGIEIVGNTKILIYYYQRQ